MLSPLTPYKIVRDLGPDWVLLRLKFALERRFGFLSWRLPAGPWNGNHSHFQSSASAVTGDGDTRRFFFGDRLFPKLSPDESQVEQADRLLAGEWPYFSHFWIKTGFPPDWRLNPYTKVRAASDAHWSEIDVESLGDVKLIWETSRFSPAFLLARAYVRNGDDRYAEGFWRLVEDWAAGNPPNTGVNWGCGQEASFRVMAWCFGKFAFAATPSSTPERLTRLVEMIAVHGERIAGHIEYALSQRNNHGISEAAGLFTIGVLFPQLPRAAEWRELGQKLLVEQLREQIYSDGSYIQHSFNYQRLMMDVAVWTLRLGELNDCRFPDECYQLLATAIEFMLRFCDPHSGRMPNYGGNDGALLLPLTSCDSQDYRPSLQAAHYLVHRKFCFAAGPWNEMAQWLLAAELHDGATKIEERRVNVSSSATSGYVKLATRSGDAMLRAAEYCDRPAQADQLHLDVWWRAENVACDAGSYLYSGNPPWQNGLARTAVHNAVTVGGRNQMTRAGRFLWLDRAQARIALASECGLKVARASHDGYKKIDAVHQRSVFWSEGDDFWIVIDEIVGKGTQSCRLHWLFPDTNYDLQGSSLGLDTSAGAFKVHWQCSKDSQISLARAGEIISGAGDCDQTRGWRSLYYAEKIPALSLAMECTARLPVTFVTVLAPEEVEVAIDDEAVRVRSESHHYEVPFSVCSVPPW